MIKLIVISIISITVGLFLQKSSNYVSFTYNNLLIEIPTWIIVAAILVFILLQSWLLRVAFNNWLQNRRSNKSIKYAKKSFFSLMAGNASIAERYALRINASSRFGWLKFLLAAKAAKEQFAWDRCHKYIIKAEILAADSLGVLSFTDNNETATFGLMKSELYYNQGEYNKCLVELKNLQKQFPSHKPLLLQLAAVYQTLADWRGLIKLLPTLKKYQIYNSVDLQQLEFKVYQALLEQLATTEPVDSMIRFFKELPKNIKKYNQFVLIYVTYLIQFKYYDLAEKTIKIHLSDTLSHWNIDNINLIKAYGLIKSSNTKGQIKTAETWLTTHPSNEVLLLTLGRLCIQEGLLGKAKNYLEKSLSIKEDPACYAELGRLTGLLGEQEKSLNCYQKGLLGITEVIKL